MFRALHPGYPATVLSLDELVPAPEREAAERLSFLTDQLPPEAADQAAEFLGALEELRAAPLAGSDDLDFAFSLLPPSPKNRALKSLLGFYLSSPLAEDRTARLAALSDEWRAGLDAPAPGQWRVVPDPARPEGLADLTASLSAAGGVSGAFVVEPWAILSPVDGARRAAHFPLCGPRSLEMAARLCERAPKTALFFQGPESERAWLAFALRARGLAFHDFHAASKNTNPLPAQTGSRKLAALRACGSLAEPERLRLAHFLSEHGAPLWNETAWEKGIERLPLSDVDKATLRALPVESEAGQPAPPESPRVFLLPFPGIDVPGDFQIVVHANLEATPRPETSPLIRESEREVLAANGFHLPRASRLQAQGKSAWAHFAARSNSRRWVFGSTGPGRTLSLPAREKPLRQSDALSPLKEIGPFSATQFETYAKCPSRYWFGHQLRVRQTDRDGSGYPLVLGQLVHKALENAFREEQPVTDEAAWSKGLPAAFTRALSEEAPEIAPDSRLAAELRGPFHELLSKVPLMELTLRQNLGNRFKPIALEKDFRFEWNGLVLRGKIDRLDESPEGDLLILDYKTGSVDFSPGHISQGKSFQPLIYLLAVEQMYGRRPAGMLFYDLKEGEVRRGLLHESAFPKEVKKAMTRGHVLDDAALDHLVSEGRAKLTEIVNHIAAADFDPTPALDLCGRCDYVAMCREGAGYV